MCAAKRAKVGKSDIVDRGEIGRDKHRGHVCSALKPADQQKLYELVGQVYCCTGGEKVSFAVSEGIIFLNDKDLKDRVVSIVDTLMQGWRASFEKEFHLCCNRGKDVEDYWCRAKDYGLPAEQYCTGCREYYCQECWQQSKHDKTATCPMQKRGVRWEDQETETLQENKTEKETLSNISQED